MKIKAVKICNFEAHEERIITFDPEATTIVGPSDIGKSSILRALRWALLNDISGLGFIREGSKKASVEVKTDVSRVRRVRGKSENLYFEDGEEFAAFGSGVPKSIEDHLNLDGCMNVQKQLDEPYWMSLTGGQLSSELNSIVDLEVIDVVTKKIKSKVKGLSDEMKVLQKTEASQSVGVEELSWVPDCLEASSEIANISEAKERAETAFTQVGCLLGSAKKKIDQISESKKPDLVFAVIESDHESILKSRKYLESLLGVVQAAKKHLKSIQDVPSLAGAQEKADSIEQGRNLISSLRGLVGAYREAKSGIKKLPKEGTIEKIEEEKRSIAVHRSMIDQLDSLISQAKQAFAFQEESSQMYSEKEEELRAECGGVCPVCGGDYDVAG